MMKHVVTLIFSIVLCASSLAQSEADSIVAMLKTNKVDTERVAMFMRLIEIHYQNDVDTAIGIAKQALTEATQTKNDVGIGEFHAWLAYLYDRIGSVDKAFKHELEGLEARRRTGNKQQIAASLNNLGYMYEAQGEIDQAMLNYRECLAIMTNFNNLIAMSAINNNIGYIYWKKHQYDSAYHYQKKALEYKIEIGDPYRIAESKSSVARTLMSLGDSAKAYQMLLHAAQVMDSLNIATGQALVYGNIANYFEGKNDYRTALKYARICYDKAKESEHMIRLRFATEQMHRIHKALGQPAKALPFYEEHIAIRDSIRNSENEKAAIELNMKLEHQEELAGIQAQQARKDAFAEAEKKRQRLLNFMFIIGGIVLLIFSAFMFNRFKITRKQKDIIEVQKAEVEEKNREILDSINYARRIQSAILPATKLVKEYLSESFILYMPKDVVAGDFYWMETTEDHVLFAAADCTGHGVPGAMVSVMCSNALSKAVKEGGIKEPAKILDKAVEYLEARFQQSEETVNDGMDLALCKLNLSTHELEYAGANNPLWVIPGDATISEEIIEIKGNKQPVGRYEHRVPFTNHKLQLNRNDTLYIFSDGFADQFGGPKGKKFKTHAFKELLLGMNGLKMEDQRDAIRNAFENWKGEHEQIDDVCVIGVRV